MNRFNVVILRIARGLVVVVAWFFAVTSVLTVAGIFAVHAVSDGAESRIWAIDGDDGWTFEAIGLTYRGATGQWIAALEVATVTACVVLSTFRHRRPGLARLGHAGLIAWNGLWLANSAWYTVMDPHAVTINVTVALMVCFACTVARAV